MRIRLNQQIRSYNDYANFRVWCYINVWLQLQLLYGTTSGSELGAIVTLLILKFVIPKLVFDSPFQEVCTILDNFLYSYNICFFYRYSERSTSRCDTFVFCCQSSLNTHCCLKRCCCCLSFFEHMSEQWSKKEELLVLIGNFYTIDNWNISVYCKGLSETCSELGICKCTSISTP